MLVKSVLDLPVLLILLVFAQVTYLLTYLLKNEQFE